MADDIARLFELAEREMRPEFRDALLDLLDEDAPAPPADARSDAAGPPVRLIDLDGPRPSRRQRRWQRGTLLLMAAVVAAVALGLQRDLARDRGDSESLQPSRDCAPGEVLGVVPTATLRLRVTLLEDGSDFCLVDDLTSLPIELLQVPLDEGSTPSSDDVPAPVLVAQGLLPGEALVYTLVVPEGMPVATVSSVDGNLPTFTSTVGRRLLVIDPRLPAIGPVDRAAYDLNLLSSAGTVLATLPPARELRASALDASTTIGSFSRS